MEIKPSVKKEVDLYKKSLKLTKWDDTSISRECRRLEKKLGVGKIEPKQYKMLRKISEGLQLGKKIDLSAAARWAGYPDWQVKSPEVTILRGIDNVLFNEIVGLNRNQVALEIVKVMKQDEDLSAKNKATEMASRIMGMTEPEKGLQINIVNDGLTVAK